MKINDLIFVPQGTRELDTLSFSCGRQTVDHQEVHHKKGMINYPAVLLAQLGVDIKFRGNHLGTQIIDFVALWFSSSRNKSGCRHLIVDAYDEPELLKFYQGNGLNFGQLETRLMFRDMILLKRDSIRNEKNIL